ncbi:MAG: hypothetical protein RI841_07465 [Halomonas sp.]|uniref:hypothetical protein n=1 Tax=Halomonas sp. TaxID=1486246 RepID=UPI0028708E27|nr:hypothetical protein [Halomonas sp.]MDR9439320.1 hypothetical protein [Halomonas sp.]
MRALKTTTALIAIAGLLTTPLAMAQGDAPENQNQNMSPGNGGNVTAQSQPQGFAAGLQQATGLSAATLGVIGGVAVIGVAVAVSDGSSTSGTN